ncbi:LPD3 domain-containing protein [Ursidibacter arcticus]
MQRINTKTLNKTLPITPNTKKAKLIAILKQWLKENVQGKYLIASDGKKIHFNSNKSVKHIAFDGSSSFLVAQTIPYIVDVFTLGQALGREELKKERKDEFIAFHSYEKTIKIGKYEVKLRAKAGELASGNIEVLPSLIAYTQYILSKKIITDDSSIAVCKNLVEYSKEQPIDYATSDNVVDNNLLIDSKQDDFTFEILAINEIVRDDTMQKFNEYLKNWGM